MQQINRGGARRGGKKIRKKKGGKKKGREEENNQVWTLFAPLIFESSLERYQIFAYTSTHIKMQNFKAIFGNASSGRLMECLAYLLCKEGQILRELSRLTLRSNIH